MNKVTLRSIQEFTTIDSTDQKHCVVLDKSDGNKLIFGRVSRELAKEHLGTVDNIACLCKFTTRLTKCKPKVNRGNKCGSRNSS